MQKTTQDRKRKMNAKEKQRLLVVAGIIVFSILIVFGILYFVFRSRVMSTADNEIYNNVYVETVDVSGMKKAEAKKAVEAKIKKYQEQSISLHIEEENVQVTLGEIGFAIKDVDGLVEKALNYGKDGSIWSRYFEVKKLDKGKEVIYAIYEIDSEKAKAVFEEKAQPLEKVAANATITRENSAFVITDEVQGKTIDAEASVKAIETYLNKKWNKKEASVDLVSVSDVPDVTREQLETIQDTLGIFTTYCGSGGGRVQNIESGTAHINGALVMPGEEYSANAAMEPYTTENGFTEAGAYENGKVVQSMGGGICQVSTTLYNAVILAELEVTQRQPHSMLVDYVKPSMDAAIAGDYKDLKFKNNTETPIYIEGYISGGNLTFTIYGKETRNANRSIEFVSETLSTTPAGKKFVEYGDSLGMMIKSGSGHTGKTARLWKVVYENGQEVSRDIFNNSTYSASPVTVNVGTASDNAEASALVKAAIATQDEGQINNAIAEAKAKIEEAAKKAEEEAQNAQNAQNATPPEAPAE